MTKSERLMHVIELMRRPDGVSVEELQKTFKVSERTVFRDLSFLAQLNVPVYFDGAYHVAEKFSLRSAGMDYVDVEILLHSLACSPLMEYPAVAERCREVMSRLRQYQPPAARKEYRRLISGREKQPSQARQPDSEMLRIFLDAVSRRRMIKVTTSRSRRPGLYVPMGIRFDGNQPVMMVSGKTGRSVRNLDVSTIKEIEESNERFSRRPVERLNK